MNLRRGTMQRWHQVPTTRPYTGLALSGGGIRSATFCLGLLRALGRAGLLPRIDYLSTVSGGSYVGAFLCSLYVPRERRGATPGSAPDLPKAPPEDPFAGDAGREALLHLRNSGRHLLPGGARDVIRVAALMTRNWIAIHFVIGVTLLALFLAPKVLQALLLPNETFLDWEAGWAADLPEVAWPNQWLQGYPLHRWFIASPLFPLAAAALLAAGLCASAFWLTRRGRDMPSGRVRRLWAPAGGVGFLTASAGGLLCLYHDAAAPTWDGAQAAGILLLIIGWGGVLVYLLAHDEEVWRDGLGWLVWPILVVYPTALALLTTTAGTLLQGLAALSTLCVVVIIGLSIRRGISSHLGKQEPARKRTDLTEILLQEDSVRSILTDWLTRCSTVTVVLGTLALFDSIAQTIYLRWSDLTALQIAGGSGLAAVVPLARWGMKAFGGAGEGSQHKRLAAILAHFGHLVALVTGLLLATAVGLFWATLAHAIAWRSGPVGRPPADAAAGSLWPLVGIWLVFAIASYLLAKSWAFVNLSSLASFYASRLRRAYLGASNRQRRELQNNRRFDDTLDENEPLDDIEVSRAGYYAPDVLAPLHLINVTVNDTASGASNLTTRDRRGKPLTVSPAGIYHAGRTAGEVADPIPLPTGPLDKAQQMPLSTWIGISGAAFTTGLGRYGSTGLSLLAGLTNLRTGYWWEAQASRYNVWKDSVQNYLRCEFLGRFRGTEGGRWYLSDGGHFENLGVFELLRRRIAFIVAADCGADPAYAFGDLIGLIRLARIELDTEVDFLEASQLDRLLGDLPDLRRMFSTLPELSRPVGEDKRGIGPYAALAQLYQVGERDRPWGTLLLVKPRICGAEMADLLAYQRDNPKFPQQPTSDQFFDEAQWESYYRLGELIGENLFRRHDLEDTWVPWQPCDLRPVANQRIAT